jgi:Transmembrane secretion effector
VIQAVYVPYAMHALGLSATGVGVTLAAFGVGMVAGALSAARIMRMLRLGTVIAIGPIAGVVAAFVMALTIWIPSPALAALSFFMMGAGPIVWVVSTTTLRQTVTPPDLLGRASAVNSAAYGARPLGGDRSGRRRARRRRGMPDPGSRRVPPPSRGDPDVAGPRARAPAQHGALSRPPGSGSAR